MSLTSSLTKRKYSARATRRMFNVWPCIRGSGVRVTHIADDFTELRTKLKLGLRNVNYFGTIFGGSLYSSTDPYFALMMLRQLGDEYVVWDKSATIRFRKPANRTLYGVFPMPPDEVAATKALADREGQCDRTYTVDLVDSDGTIYATVEKTIYVARKAHHKTKPA